MITHKQLTLAEVFEDCQNKFDNDKYQFLSLLDEAINLDEIVPVSFVFHFRARTGRPRKHQLYPMLKALLLQRIFSILTDTLLVVFLKYSQELRDFCGFDLCWHRLILIHFFLLVFFSAMSSAIDQHNSCHNHQTTCQKF